MLITEVTSFDTANISDAIASSVVLYRGTPDVGRMAVGKTQLVDVRSDRKTRDSTEIETYIFNTIMELNRLPVRKNNSVSLTVDRDQAREYGKLVRVFPLNGSKFIYSPAIHDWWEPIVKILYDIFASFKDELGLEYPTSNEPMSPMLLPHVELVKTYLQKNISNINSALQIHSTSNINDLQSAKGEILLYGASQYVIKRISLHGSE